MKKTFALFFVLFCLAHPETLFAGALAGEQVAQGIELLILPVEPSIAYARDNQPAQREAAHTQDARPTTPSANGKSASSEDHAALDQNAENNADAAQVGPRISKKGGAPAEIVVLRVDPKLVAFELHLASNTGKALSLEEWARSQDLAIATNAGMFLPDGLTNTGYMRYNEHVNNGRIVKNFGAFFVASPIPGAKPQLKSAAILDRQADAWEDVLPNYGLVIQNYRLINEKGKPIWRPDGKSFSTSALAQDADGHILFIFCAHPLNGYNFARAVLALPLHVTRLMYLEGGTPATLILNTPQRRQVWNNSGMLGGLLPPSPIPNVLGVKIRK